MDIVHLSQSFGHLCRHLFKKHHSNNLFIVWIKITLVIRYIWHRHQLHKFFLIISKILQICICANPAHCRGGTLCTACKCSFPSARSHWSILDHVDNPALSLVELSLPAWLRGSTSLLTVSHPLLVRMPYVLLLSWSLQKSDDSSSHCHEPGRKKEI